MSAYDERIAKLNQLMDEGLQFGECVEQYHLRQDDKLNQLAALAAEKHEVEGEVEIDPNAIVSIDNLDEEVAGAYVMGWLWVDLPQVEDDEDS